MIDFGSNSGGTLDRRWWLADEGREHERLWAQVERIRRQDAPRRATMRRHLRMYGSYARDAQFGNAPDLPPDRLRYNLASESVDTLVAEITSSKPKAAILTTGGDWTLRQAAKARELVVEGQMRDAGIYEGLARAVQRDAELVGDGFVEVYVDWHTLTPKADRCLPGEVLVDQAGGRYGKPREIYRQLLIDRAVLMEQHGKTAALRKAITEAPRYTATDDALDGITADANESDLVLVIKAWHLPSAPKAKDGRHVVAIRGATLYSSAFTRDRFPLPRIKWGESAWGYFGTGVVAAIEADQIELNRTLRRLQEAAGVAAGVWLLERQARVRKQHLTDLPGACVEYSGVKPEYMTPGTVPADLVAHADRIIARALARLGISQMMANAIKPAGLNSGEAQRVHADVFSRRQIEHVQTYEAFHVDVARAFVDANEDILTWLDSPDAKGREMPAVSVEVKRGRRRVLKRLRFDEVSLPENAWRMQPMPMSSLPSEPSGRQATITEWLQGGIIDQVQAKALMDVPDTESALDLELADYDFALWAFETMVEDGEYVSPEPFQNLDLALELIRKAYLRARIDGVPSSRLDLVRNHMSALRRLIDKRDAPTLADAAASPDALGGAAPVDPALAAGAPTPELAGALPDTLSVAA